MSDLWTFAQSSVHPIVHHSSLSRSLPPLSSPSSFRNHGNPPPAKVTSPHLSPPQLTQTQVSLFQFPQPQVTSPHPHQPQVTSPHPHQPQVTSPHLHQPQVTSPHLHQPQVTSPHPHQPQVTSPHLHQPQVTSPHPHQPQVTSPHLHQPQVTSPHPHQPQVTSPHPNQPQVTSPHLHQPQVTPPNLLHTQLMSPCHAPQMQVSSSQLFYKSQVTSPHHLGPPQVHSPLLSHPNITSPHLMSQHLLFNQSHDPALDYPNWNKCDSSDLSDFLNGNRFSYQNQTTGLLDHHLQPQDQFSTGETYRDELENPNKPYNTQTPHVVDIPGPGQHAWGHLMPTMSQQQCAPLGSISAGGTGGRWSSIDLSSLCAQDFPSNQAFHENYHDNNGPQPFCSPTTPGPSPHYPQTPAVSSPGPQMHPRTETAGSQTQTSTHLSRDHTFDCGPNEFDCYLLGSDTGQQHPHETSKHPLLSQSEPIQEMMGLLGAAGGSETSFSPKGRGQKGSNAGPTLGPAAGKTSKEEYERGIRGGRRGRDGQAPLTWVQPRSNADARDSRLQCTVCKRDFRSLPALNGHMRSHSGFRSPTLVKKDMSPPAQNPVSIVMPVSVPIQTRGMSLVRGGGQRRCSIPPLGTRGPELYRSLMRLEEEESSAPEANEGGVVRAGPGLYCSVTTRRQQRVQTVQLHNGLNDPVAMATASPPPGTLTSGIITPRINLGRSFQAEIPSLRDRKYTVSDSHNALLLWMPWDKLMHPFNQQRVESLLIMARSSVVPGGGASPEYVLHILSESRGDFLLTLEKLLTTPETSDNNHAGVRWSPAEKKLLVKSLKLHHKNFSIIQKAVQTKSLSECIEYYYLWKKKLNLSMRTQAGLTVTLPDTNEQRLSKSQKAS